MNYPPNVTMIDDLPDLDELVGPPMGPPGFDPRMTADHAPGRGFSGYRGQPPPQEVPDVSRAIRGQHIPPMESGMMGPRMNPHNVAGGGYNKYGSAYGPQIGPGPHRMPQMAPMLLPPQRMAQGRPINIGPGLQAPEPPPPSIMNQRGIPVMSEDINPYPFAGGQDNFEVTINEGYEDTQNKSSMGSCLDISNHVENCPICRKLYKNDKTVLIIAIVILAILCILLLKKVLNL